jgi:hypothetical protein
MVGLSEVDLPLDFCSCWFTNLNCDWVLYMANDLEEGNLMRAAVAKFLSLRICLDCIVILVVL